MPDVTSVVCTVDNLLSATVAFHSLSSTKETEFGKKLDLGGVHSFLR